MNQKYNKELADIIETKRKEWIENLKNLSPLLRNKPELMTDANALSISYRAMILDEINYFSNLFASHDKEMKVLKRDKFIFYSTGLLPDGTKPKAGSTHPILGKKMTKSEYDCIISGDLSEQEYTLQLINDIVSFLKESVKTIDQVLYGIKNRLELFNYLKY